MSARGINTRESDYLLLVISWDISCAIVMLMTVECYGQHGSAQTDTTKFPVLGYTCWKWISN